MKIKIVSLRKTDSADILRLEKEYLKRFSSYANVVFVDVARAKIKGKHRTESTLEVQKVLSVIDSKDYFVLLSERGKEPTSVEFAQFLEKQRAQCFGSLVFVIGGPEGYPQELESHADCILSLSKLTFPHKLVRLLLLEGLYRSFDIIAGGPYHK